MKNEKTGKIKTVRGSVLFTTVSVMALLIIFLTGALALASSANNRAHKSYASSQASYNARAAIDSFTQAMVSNTGVAAAVHDMGEAGLQPVLRIGDGAWTNNLDDAKWEKSTSNGWGTIGYYDASGVFQEGKLDIRKTGKPEYGWDPKGGDDGKGAWVELTEYKITATAKYGREEETVTAYLKTQIKEEEQKTVIKGLQSLGEENDNTAGTVYGGLGVALNLDDDPFTNVYSYVGTRFASRTELTFVNASMVCGNGNNEIGVYEKGAKTIILGNFRVKDGSKLIWVDYEGGAPQSQKEIPYFYVNGLLSISNAKNFVQSFDSTNGSKPFNIFAGTVDVQTMTEFGSADIYMMDSVSERDYTIDGVTAKAGKNKISGGNSKLYKWTESFSGGSGYESTVGGNIYCNGDLEISGNDITFGGDVRVAGNCTINGKTTMNGKLIVGGNLTVKSELMGINVADVSVGGTCDWPNHTGVNKLTPVLKEGFEERTNYRNHLGKQADYYVYRSIGEIGLFGEKTGIYNNDLYYQYDDVFNSEWTDDEKIAHINKSVAPVTGWGSPVTAEYDMYTPWFDGRSPGADIPIEHQEDGEKSYYNADGQRVALSNAVEYTTEIYPKKMTREAIYGECNDYNMLLTPAKSDTKLITTLAEARNALGLGNATGEVPAMYDAMKLLEERGLANAEGVLNNSKLKEYSNFGIGDNVIDAKDGTDVRLSGTFSGSGEGDGSYCTVKIQTGSEHMNVILDSLTLNNTRIVVDTDSIESGKGKGSVTFFILGTLKVNNSKIVSKATETNKEVKFSDQYGMVYYGAEGSVIDCTNHYLLVGSLKTANTSLYAAGGNNGNSGYTYIDEYDRTMADYKTSNGASSTPGIIGNGIFKDTQLSDDFSIFYTETGNGKTNNNGSRTLFSATNDIYELSYYGAA